MEGAGTAERVDIPEGTKELCIEQLYNVLTLQNITIVLKSRRIRLVGHVEHMGMGKMQKVSLIKWMEKATLEL